MRVRDIMTKNVVPISLDEQIDLVDEVMKEGNIRHMPVTKGGRVVGIVSQRDLLRAQLSSIAEYSQDEKAQFLQGVDVEQIMTAKVKVADPDELAVDAARRMIEARIGCLPVVDREGDLIGLITETDIMRHYVEIAGKDDK